LAHRLISADRFDEQAHRLLVTTLLSADELSEAERAHTAWADAMSELGVDVDSLATLRRA
jgi:DNA-binding SARP family transcriptional activator